MLFLRSIAIFLYATSIIAAPEQSPEEPRGGGQPRRRLGFYSDFFSTIESMNISASKVALDNVLHLIKYRFNLDNKYRAQVFSVAANLNNNAWDIMKVL